MKPRESPMAVSRAAALGRVLAQHHLLDPAQRDAIVHVADDLIGLHATNPSTPYLSLRARIHGFAPQDMDDALYERRELVRLKAMRGTVFVFSREMAPLAFAATRAATVASDRRWFTTKARDYDHLAPAVLAALAGQSLTARELAKTLDADAELTGVLGLLCDEGQIVRDRPVSVRSTTFRYRRWTDAFPDVHLDAWDEAAATRELVRRYLDSYGPASRADVIWWTGLPARQIDRALDAFSDELVTTTIPGIGDRLLATASCAARAAATNPTTGHINLLPMLDPYTMSYKDRRRFLDPHLHELVIDRGGNVTSVVLVDGRVGGVWDLTDAPAPAVRVLVFDPWSQHRRHILDRAEHAGAFWFGGTVPVQEYASMVPLRLRTGVMRRPLDDAQPRVTARAGRGR